MPGYLASPVNQEGVRYCINTIIIGIGNIGANRIEYRILLHEFFYERLSFFYKTQQLEFIISVFLKNLV